MEARMVLSELSPLHLSHWIKDVKCLPRAVQLPLVSCANALREERLVAFFEHPATRIRVWSEASAHLSEFLGKCKR